MNKVFVLDIDFGKNTDLFGRNFDKMCKRQFLTFMTTFNTWLAPNTFEYPKGILKIIIIYNNVDLIIDYKILHYRFGIRLCTILAKCWKLLTLEKTPHFVNRYVKVMRKKNIQTLYYLFVYLACATFCHFLRSVSLGVGVGFGL